MIIILTIYLYSNTYLLTSIRIYLIVKLLCYKLLCKVVDTGQAMFVLNGRKASDANWHLLLVRKYRFIK